MPVLLFFQGRLNAGVLVFMSGFFGCDTAGIFRLLNKH